MVFWAPPLVKALLETRVTLPCGLREKLARYILLCVHTCSTARDNAQLRRILASIGINTEVSSRGKESSIEVRML